MSLVVFCLCGIGTILSGAGGLAFVYLCDGCACGTVNLDLALMVIFMLVYGYFFSLSCWAVMSLLVVLPLSSIMYCCHLSCCFLVAHE